MSIYLAASLRYGNFVLTIDTSIGSGITCVLGPSGSGKTTMLRLIAGLSSCPNAHIYFNGTPWHDCNYKLPVHRRSIGYVFQQPTLFPHLSVRGNIAYAQRRAHSNHASANVDQLLDLLDIKHLMDASIQQLSGGEMQRVALARALAAKPQLLLLDEPLASLDAHRKTDILHYIQRIHDQSDLPIVYVTHARDEAEYLANDLIVLDQGKIVAQGTLTDVLSRIDVPLAKHANPGVVLTAQVTHFDPRSGLATLHSQGISFTQVHTNARVGSWLRVRIGARDVQISTTQSPTNDGSALPARILHSVLLQSPHPLAGYRLLRLAAGNHCLLSLIHDQSTVARHVLAHNQCTIHISQVTPISQSVSSV